MFLFLYLKVPTIESLGSRESIKNTLSSIIFTSTLRLGVNAPPPPPPKKKEMNVEKLH